MGLISKEVEVSFNSQNIKWYEDKGYKIPREKDKRGRITVSRGTKIKVKVEDLPDGSNVFVDVQCDECGEIKPMKWTNYKKYVHENGKYYCKKCACRLYGVENSRVSQLKNGQSFGYWLIKNLSLRQAIEIILRWDEKKNSCDIRDIGYASSGFNRKGYWFKCLTHLEHGSELKSINRFTSGYKKSLDCIACNSIGQYIIDTYGEDALEKYWSKNNTVNPFVISKGSDNIKVYFVCQEDETHTDYPSVCYSWMSGCRCPSCSFSKGEKRIENYLINNNLIKDQDYISQKKFNKLIGLGGGNLSYDFYLPKYNLLIEYQGEQHERPIDFDGKGIKYAEENFKKQLEHDKRKKEYADNHNIKLLEIWYYDYDNIEMILDRELNINKDFKEVI